MIMLDAVKSGDAKKLAEMIRQDPGFDVNIMVQDGAGRTLLHYACLGDSRSAVIPLLLAHPDIDVNVKNRSGGTPFYYACGYPSCAREMLKDSKMETLHSGMLLIMAPLTSSSGGSRLEERWISGQQGMSTGRMPLAEQRSTAMQRW